MGGWIGAVLGLTPGYGNRFLPDHDTGSVGEVASAVRVGSSVEAKGHPTIVITHSRTLVGGPENDWVMSGAKIPTARPQTETTPAMPISEEFPYESRYVEVLGSSMHYVEQGEGDPILFLHGNPTSSYLWRNIIPYASPHGRAIAVDLIGMGKSAKPDIDYRFVDHARYLDGFIETLGLTNVTLVIHDWGSGLGFHYAHRNPDNVRGIAFMEAILKPAEWSDANPVVRFIFKRMRDQAKGDRMNMDNNFFIKRLLPMMTSRKLSAVERETYGAPYPDRASRKPVAVWPREIPFVGDGPADMNKIVTDYAAWLKTTEIPKLLLHAKPGIILTKDSVAELEATLSNLTSVHIGKGKHYVQEDQPDAIGQALAEWLAVSR